MRNKFSNYKINKDGSLYRISSDRQITNRPKKGMGYIQYCITNDSGDRQDVYAHRLVASEYLNDLNTKVDHINGIKHDNRLENLRLCTQVDNVNYGNNRKHDLPNYISKQVSKNCKQGFQYIYRRDRITLKSSVNLFV